MLARLQSILDWRSPTTGRSLPPMRSSVVDPGVAAVGRTTLQQWATQAEARVSAERQPGMPPCADSKNADVVVRLWRVSVEERSGAASAALPAPPPDCLDYPARWPWTCRSARDD